MMSAHGLSTKDLVKVREQEIQSKSTSERIRILSDEVQIVLDDLVIVLDDLVGGQQHGR